MRHSRWLLIVVCLLVHTTAGAQDSQPQSARTAASERFHRGVELFQDQAYVAALVEFERAYELLPDYRVLFNIGRTKFELQDFLGAVQAFERYLAEGGPGVPEERRTEVEGTLRSLRSRIGRVLIHVDRENVDIFVDDVKIGRAPLDSSVPVNVGRHRIMARADDGASDQQSISVPGNETVDVFLNMPVARVEERAAQPVERPPFRKLAIIGWSAGGALLLGALTTGILTLSADRDFEQLHKRVNVDPAEEKDQRQKLKTYALTTDVLVSTGAALAAVGTVLWIVDRRQLRREDEAQQGAKLKVDVGIGTVRVHGRF